MVAKRFVSRYEEKQFLKGSTTFKSFNEDEDFLALFRIDNQQNITNEEA